MPMTTTLGTLVGVEQPLQRLAAQPLPISTAYLVLKLRQAVASEMQFFNAQRSQMIRELGEAVTPTPEQVHSGVSELYQVKPENFDVFQTRMDELALVNVTLVVTPIPVDALQQARVSADDLDALTLFLTGL